MRAGKPRDETRTAAAWMRDDPYTSNRVIHDEANTLTYRYYTSPL